MNRIANILLYAGLEREDFKSCKAYIDEDNRKRLFGFFADQHCFSFCNALSFRRNAGSGS